MSLFENNGDICGNLHEIFCGGFFEIYMEISVEAPIEASVETSVETHVRIFVEASEGFR